MAVVTISRQLGSGGNAIGQAVARALGATLLDKEITRLAAERVGLPAEGMAGSGEQRDPRLTRLISLLMLYDEAAMPPELLAAEAATPTAVASTTFRHMMEEVVREVAARGQAVIIGRGSQVLLQGQPRTLHVHIRAPMAARVERLRAERGVDAAEAERLAHASDQERGAYVREVYGVDWEASDLYDLVINTARLSQEAAVAAIVAAARALDEGQSATAERLYQRVRQPQYSVEEAARLLFMNPEVIRHAVYAGDLPAQRAGRDIVAIQRRDLLAWLERQPVTASST